MGFLAPNPSGGKEDSTGSAFTGSVRSGKSKHTQLYHHGTAIPSGTAKVVFLRGA